MDFLWIYPVVSMFATVWAIFIIVLSIIEAKNDEPILSTKHLFEGLILIIISYVIGTKGEILQIKEMINEGNNSGATCERDSGD